jgi:hypothetical protein
MYDDIWSKEKEEHRPPIFSPTVFAHSHFSTFVLATYSTPPELLRLRHEKQHTLAPEVFK